MSQSSDKPQTNIGLQNILMHMRAHDTEWKYLQSSLTELFDRCWKRGDSNPLPFSFRNEDECVEFTDLMNRGVIEALRLPGAGRVTPDNKPVPCDYEWEGNIIHRADGYYDMEVRIVERTPVRV